MKKCDTLARFQEFLLTCSYAVLKANEHPPGGRGQHADPVRDVLLYIYGTMLHIHKRPKRPGLEPSKPSWNEVYRQLEKIFFKKPAKKDVIILLPLPDGTFLKLTIDFAAYEKAFGLNFASIGHSGIRTACARGKRIFESVRENMERSNLITTVSTKPVKSPVGGIRTLEIVLKTETRSHQIPTLPPHRTK